MNIALRISAHHHRQLIAHLLPGDGKEAAAVALCGRGEYADRHILTVHELHLVPYDQCERTPYYISWPTEPLVPIIKAAADRGMAFVKLHSHPGGYIQFSRLDDETDSLFFPTLYGWMDDERPHASVVMLPDGRLFGRVVDPSGRFGPLESVMVAGDDILLWNASDDGRAVPGFAYRNGQVFGEGTVSQLRKMTIGVVGCSGTGSPVVEQLVRLGVGRLVIIDPDHVQEKNLNRILNTTMEDAARKVPKVEIVRWAVEAIGLGTEVIPVQKDLYSWDAVKAISICDAVFGCMDSVDGRHLLNRIATFYLIPYIDVGVGLSADGRGGIEHIAGVVNYIKPGGSSLLSRAQYTMEEVEAAALRRTDREEYERRRASKYILGVDEERPAVISVNMFFAALAVNEFLARVHPYKDDDNGQFAVYKVSLNQSRIYKESDGEPDHVLDHQVGRGDMQPLLNWPFFSAGSANKKVGFVG